MPDSTRYKFTMKVKDAITDSANKGYTISEGITLFNIFEGRCVGWLWWRRTEWEVVGHCKQFTKNIKDHIPPQAKAGKRPITFDKVFYNFNELVEYFARYFKINVYTGALL